MLLPQPLDESPPSFNFTVVTGTDVSVQRQGITKISNGHPVECESIKRLYRQRHIYNVNTVIEIWECAWDRLCRQTRQIYEFIDSMRPGFYQRHKGKITQNDIMKGVLEGELFGMVEVDLQVPEKWPRYFQHPILTPYQYFAKMSPLFCTTEIPFDAIGNHMQRHIEDDQISKAPRRLLVGGMKGEKNVNSNTLPEMVSEAWNDCKSNSSSGRISRSALLPKVC